MENLKDILKEIKRSKDLEFFDLIVIVEILKTITAGNDRLIFNKVKNLLIKKIVKLIKENHNVN